MSLEDQHNDENTPPTGPNPLYSEATPYGATPPPAMYSHYAPLPPPPAAVPPPFAIYPPPPLAVPPVIFRWPLLFMFLLIGVGAIVESLLVRGGNTLLLFISQEAESIEKFARHEVVLYVPVPFGFILGMIVGLIRQQAPLPIIVFCFQLVLSSMSIVLLYFLLVGFWRMCDPLFKTSPVAVPALVVKKRERSFNQQIMKEDADQKYIDLVCDVSELRKIYKYDSLHNTILLVIFVAVVVRTTGVNVDIKLLVGGLLMATLLFSEVPYGIGQYLLHQRVLEQYTGTRHVEMAKKLTEYAPAFLPLPFVGSLITTGTIGPALYILFDQFARDAWSSFIK